MFNLFNKYSLNAYKVQGMSLGPREIDINKTSFTLPSRNLQSISLEDNKN